MPEIPYNIPLVNAIKAEIKPDTQISDQEIYARLAPLYPETEYIGKGSQSIVVGHPLSPNKVLAFEHSPKTPKFPLEFSEIYHIHKVLSTLFPENFPRIYATSLIGSVRQRIEGKKIGSEVKEPTDMEGAVEYYINNLKEAVKKYKILVALAKNVGINLEIDAGSPNNFVIGPTGETIYLDLISNRSDDFTIDLKQAVALIRNRSYSNLGLIATQKKRLQQERALISSMRRIYELSIIKKHYKESSQVVENSEIERELKDIFNNTDLSSRKKRHAVAQSTDRINKTLIILSAGERT